jgi:hypothetical protein
LKVEPAVVWAAKLATISLVIFKTAIGLIEGLFALALRPKRKIGIVRMFKLIYFAYVNL